MNKPPMFSVIIPTYNYGHVVTRAIDSVLAQTNDNFELIVINDGSSDNTCEAVEQHLSAHENRYRFISHTNRGVSATRNRGIDESTGDYLIFLDADDCLLENALMSFYEAITEHTNKVGIVVGAHYSADQDGKKKLHPNSYSPASKSDCFSAYLNKRISLSNGACAVSRDVFRKIRYNESLRHAEDIPVFAQIIANFESVFIDIPVVTVNKHADSMRNDSSAAAEAGLRLVDELFNADILPAELMQFRNDYLARRCLSLFRTLYRDKKYAQAADYFKLACKTDWRSLVKWSYTKKYFSMRLKQLIGRG